MLHPKLRSMLLHGKVGRVLCSSDVLPAPSFSSPCASCTFFFIFFSLITEEKQTFFLDMGDLKRDQSSVFRFYLSVFIYMIHFFFFLLAGVSSRLHVLAVPSLRMCVLLTPVLLSCKIVALLFQSGRLCQVIITLHTWV